MTKMRDKKELIRTIKFTLFSISAGVIELVLFEILYSLIHWDYWVSYLIALIASVIWNFTLNREFTFKSANNVPIAMTKVAVFYAIFTPTSTICGNHLESIGWNGTLVTIINMICNFVLEYLYDRFFVFGKSIDTKVKHEIVFHLDNDIFEVVKSGTKTVEVRLNDEKRKKLKVGDKLIFLNKNNEEEKVESIVEELKHYNSFNELIEDYSIEEVYLPGYTKDYFIDLLKRFYTDEQEKENGVLAIRFRKA